MGAYSECRWVVWTDLHVADGLVTMSERKMAGWKDDLLADESAGDWDALAVERMDAHSAV